MGGTWPCAHGALSSLGTRARAGSSILPDCMPISPVQHHCAAHLNPCLALRVCHMPLCLWNSAASLSTCSFTEHVLCKALPGAELLDTADGVISGVCLLAGLPACLPARLSAFPPACPVLPGSLNTVTTVVGFCNVGGHFDRKYRQLTNSLDHFPVMPYSGRVLHPMPGRKEVPIL